MTHIHYSMKQFFNLPFSQGTLTFSKSQKDSSTETVHPFTQSSFHSSVHSLTYNQSTYYLWEKMKKNWDLETARTTSTKNGHRHKDLWKQCWKYLTQVSRIKKEREEHILNVNVNIWMWIQALTFKMQVTSAKWQNSVPELNSINRKCSSGIITLHQCRAATSYGVFVLKADCSMG